MLIAFYYDVFKQKKYTGYHTQIPLKIYASLLKAIRHDL